MGKDNKVIKYVNKDYKTNNNILVVIEDTGCVYELLVEYLKILYKDVKFKVVGSGGNAKLLDTINIELTNEDNSFSGVILIYDSGVDTLRKSMIMKVENSICNIKAKNAIDIHIFKPLSFEILLIAFDEIINMVGTDKDKSIVTNLSSITSVFGKNIGIIEVTLYKLGYHEGSLENKMETIFEEITAGTPYKYKHSPSTISDCWYNNCCNKPGIKFCGHTYIPRRTKDKNKVLDIVNHSGLFGLTYIINTILGVNTQIPSNISWIKNYISRVKVGGK